MTLFNKRVLELRRVSQPFILLERSNKKVDHNFFKKIIDGIKEDFRNYTLAYVSLCLVLSLQIFYIPRTTGAFRYCFKSFLDNETIKSILKTDEFSSARKVLESSKRELEIIDKNSKRIVVIFSFIITLISPIIFKRKEVYRTITVLIFFSYLLSYFYLYQSKSSLEGNSVSCIDYQKSLVLAEEVNKGKDRFKLLKKLYMINDLLYEIGTIFTVLILYNGIAKRLTPKMEICLFTCLSYNLMFAIICYMIKLLKSDSNLLEYDYLFERYVSIKTSSNKDKNEIVSYDNSIRDNTWHSFSSFSSRRKQIHYYPSGVLIDHCFNNKLPLIVSIVVPILLLMINLEDKAIELIQDNSFSKIIKETIGNPFKDLLANNKLVFSILFLSTFFLVLDTELIKGINDNRCETNKESLDISTDEKYFISKVGGNSEIISLTELVKNYPSLFQDDPSGKFRYFNDYEYTTQTLPTLLSDILSPKGSSRALPSYFLEELVLISDLIYEQIRRKNQGYLIQSKRRDNIIESNSNTASFYNSTFQNDLIEVRNSPLIFLKGTNTNIFLKGTNTNINRPAFKVVSLNFTIEGRWVIPPIIINRDYLEKLMHNHRINTKGQEREVYGTYLPFRDSVNHNIENTAYYENTRILSVLFHSLYYKQSRNRVKDQSETVNSYVVILVPFFITYLCTKITNPWLKKNSTIIVFVVAILSRGALGYYFNKTNADGKIEFKGAVKNFCNILTNDFITVGNISLFSDKRIYELAFDFIISPLIKIVCPELVELLINSTTFCKPGQTIRQHYDQDSHTFPIIPITKVDVLEYNQPQEETNIEGINDNLKYTWTQILLYKITPFSKIVDRKTLFNRYEKNLPNKYELYRLTIRAYIWTTYLLVMLISSAYLYRKTNKKEVLIKGIEATPNKKLDNL